MHIVYVGGAAMTEDRSGQSSVQRSWLEKLSQALLGEPRDRQQLIDILRESQQRHLLDQDELGPEGNPNLRAADREMDGFWQCVAVVAVRFERPDDLRDEVRCQQVRHLPDHPAQRGARRYLRPGFLRAG